MSDSVGEALPREIKRIRETVIPAYESIGPAGMFGLAFIRQSLTRAEDALSSGDVIAIVRAYADLKEIKA